MLCGTGFLISVAIGWFFSFSPSPTDNLFTLTSISIFRNRNLEETFRSQRGRQKTDWNKQKSSALSWCMLMKSSSRSPPTSPHILWSTRRTLKSLFMRPMYRYLISDVLIVACCWLCLCCADWLPCVSAWVSCNLGSGAAWFTKC